MRPLVCLALAGCSASPCDGLPDTCVVVEVSGRETIDEIDLVLTGDAGKRLTARESRLDGKPIPLPARFAAIVPGDGSFTLQGVGALQGNAEDYGQTGFVLPPHRQIVPLMLSALSASSDGGELPDLGGFQVGADLTGTPPDLLAVVTTAEDLAVDLATSANDLSIHHGWTPQASGTTNSLYSLWGDGSGKVVAVGTQGTILYTTNGGAIWYAGDSGVSDDVYGVWGSSAGDVWAVGEDATILHSTNGGTSWTQKSVAPAGSIITLTSVWGSGPGKIHAVGAETNGGDSFSTTNSGSQWSSGATSKGMFAVWGSSADDVYVVGDSGLVAHVAGGGDDWVEQSNVSSNGLGGIWGSGPQDIYLVGEKGTLLHSTNGTTWTKIDSGTTVTLSWIWGASANDIYIVGDNGTILHSTDAGKSWPSEPSGTQASLLGVWGSGSQVYAVGAGGVILIRN